VCDWFQGGPHHVVYRRVIRSEVLPNGIRRLHLGYVDDANSDEEVFEGKTPEEASRNLESYLRHAHGFHVHDSNVDMLDTICSPAADLKPRRPRR
jgi:hypothetical protein